MAIYAVIAPEPAPKLEEAIAEHFPQHFYKVAPDQFLVSSAIPTTTKISERLGLPKGELGKAMVLHVLNWNGWHNKDIWEWLSAQTKTGTSDRELPSG